MYYRGTHLSKLDIIVNKCLRLSIGAMRSTPTTNLYVECSEMPLPRRREYLTSKFIYKITDKNSQLLGKIHDLFIMDLTSKYWKKKSSLLIVNVYSSVMDNLKEMYTSGSNLIYKLDLYKFKSPEVYYFRDYSVFPATARNSMFQYDFTSEFPDFHPIYTDASKINYETGAAIWDPKLKTSGQYKLNSKFSVYTAELVAILEALKYIKSIGKDNFVILSDCKSALDKINNISENSKLNYIIYEIITLFQELTLSKIVKFAWIKAHCGLRDNEIVDNMAKNASEVGHSVEYKCNIEDMQMFSKRGIKENWKSEYENSTKGKFYRSIQPDVPPKPWFKQTSFNKRAISVICRLRFQHALFPSHLFKIKLADSPLCECGEEGNAEHKILGCELIKESIKDLNTFIYSLKDITKPYNLASLLMGKNLFVYKYLYLHICNIKLKL